MKLKRIFLLAAGLVFAIYNAEASDNVTWNVTIANNTSATIYLGGTPEGRAHCWDLSPDKGNQLYRPTSLKAHEVRTFETKEIISGDCSYNMVTGSGTNYMEFLIDGQIDNDHLVNAYAVSLNSIYSIGWSLNTTERKILYNSMYIATLDTNSSGIINVRIDYNGSGNNLTAVIGRTSDNTPSYRPNRP